MASPVLERHLADLRARVKAKVKRDCEEDLYTFFEQAWPHFDSVEFMGNWHLEVLCHHLERVTYGHERRLIINVPPRTAKTALISVVWPLWCWIQDEKLDTCGPGTKFLCASYSYELSVESAEKSRRLMNSDWFQGNWGDKFKIFADANRKDNFVNNHNGARISTSVGGTITGRGGSIIIVDDPNSGDDANSQASRETVKRWWDETLSTRLNDPRTGAFVVVQQRLHQEDITGHIISTSTTDWTHLKFPMRYEDTDTACRDDIRTVDGELLWPERWGEDQVKDLEDRLKEFAAAGQLQQRPTIRGGSIIKDEWWQNWEGKNSPPMDYVIASLDTAMTVREKADFSALTVWGSFQSPGAILIGEDGSYDFSGVTVYERETGENWTSIPSTTPKLFLCGAWRAKLTLPDLVEKVIATCLKWRVQVLLIENKAHGHAVEQTIRDLTRNLPFGITMFDPRQYGDKAARLYSVQHLFQEGLVYAPTEKDYANMVIEEMSAFPQGAHDDLCDSSSQALHHMRQRGFVSRPIDTATNTLRSLTNRRGSQKALYET